MTDITTSKLWHVFNVILYVVGIAGGISGGATFHFHFNNNAASLWAAVSVLVIFICLVQELLKHNDRLHVCHTHHSLIICQVLASLMALVLVVLSVMHFVVAYVGEEALENMEFNDYIVGIWTLYCLKGTLALCYSSHKCRKRLLHLEATIPRSESPNFQSGAFIPYDPLLSSYSEASHVSSRDSYRRRPVVLDDESVGTECDSVTSVQAAANRVVLVVSDGESASDMDRVADELDVGASGFGGSRLVLT